jgi:hypothetical protein
MYSCIYVFMYTHQGGAKQHHEIAAASNLIRIETELR